MLFGILGGFVSVAAVFFGGFVILDYVWDRLGGDS